MNPRFEFATASRIIFGPGVLAEIGSIAKDYGKRALVITSGPDSPRAKAHLTILKEHGIEGFGFCGIGSEPQIQNVRSFVLFAKRERFDYIIGIGGGSVIDTAKAIAVLLTNDGEIFDYLEIIGRGQPLKNPAVPFIAIPTTAGTGSEVTRNSVLASPEHRLKVSLRSPLMLPRVALVDPEVTYDLPPALTASTGLDALTQLIEPYVCSRANPMTDALCAEGMVRAARSLRIVFEKGRDAAAREDMACASLFGGLALANAGLGAVHGLAGPIGGMFPAPHGAVVAALLPHVMETNLRALRQRQPSSDALRRYETVARLLTGKPAATADDGVEWVRGLVADLSIPPLRSYGITAAHSSELAARAQNASSMKANPVALTNAELEEILARAL